MDKKTNNDPQNTTQKTKDWATWTALKFGGYHIQVQNISGNNKPKHGRDMYLIPPSQLT